MSFAASHSLFIFTRVPPEPTWPFSTPFCVAVKRLPCRLTSPLVHDLTISTTLLSLLSCHLAPYWYCRPFPSVHRKHRSFLQLLANKMCAVKYSSLYLERVYSLSYLSISFLDVWVVHFLTISFNDQRRTYLMKLASARGKRGTQKSLQKSVSSYMCKIVSLDKKCIATCRYTSRRNQKQKKFLILHSRHKDVRIFLIFLLISFSCLDRIKHIIVISRSRAVI